MVNVALLRGVNVGGKNKVNMEELKKIFSNLGFTSIVTYINSGNVVFTAQETPEALRLIIEAELEEQLGFKVIVLVKAMDDYLKIAESIPPHLVNNKLMRADVLFLFKAIDDERVVEKIPQREGVDNILYVPGAIIYWVARDAIGKSQLVKIVGTNVYKEMTLRNVNTVRKILELMKKPT